MAATPVRCLVLACGNTLRSDDGVGPWLADWVEARFAAEPTVRVIARQQWTPDLAEDIAQAAKHYIKNGKFTEGILNRVEAVVRTFDPCLSCSTHAFGKMPLAISLLNADGEQVDLAIR